MDETCAPVNIILLIYLDNEPYPTVFFYAVAKDCSAKPWRYRIMVKGLRYSMLLSLSFGWF